LLARIFGKEEKQIVGAKKYKNIGFYGESDFALTIYRISGRNVLNTKK